MYIRTNEIFGQIPAPSHGHLYKWDEEVNGVGYPIGFWWLFQRAGGGNQHLRDSIQDFDPATHPWQAAIQLFGGRVVAPTKFPRSQAGFQQYLDATGVQYFSAKEMTTPHRRSIAKRLGYTIFLPKHEWWPQAAALAKLADRIRTLVNGSVKMRNWWRPRDYNKAVKGAGDSDHITAKGVDLDYRSADDRRQAEAFLKKIRRQQPWLRMSLGLGNRTTHIGLLTRRGERTWKYKSYKR